jgi:hypothetical protein
MKPDTRFSNQNKDFWANVRLISEEAGYTSRGSGQIKIPSIENIKHALLARGLVFSHICDDSG